MYLGRDGVSPEHLIDYRGSLSDAQLASYNSPSTSDYIYCKL